MEKLIDTINTDDCEDVISDNIAIEDLKKELGITNKDIAYMFELSHVNYRTSSAKKRYERALCRFSDVCRERWQKGKEKGIAANDGEPS